MDQKVKVQRRITILEDQLDRVCGLRLSRLDLRLRLDGRWEDRPCGLGVPRRGKTKDPGVGRYWVPLDGTGWSPTFDPDPGWAS